ncbi:MAG: DUF4190 domain-containing protein [Thermoleophilia bacterium]
MDRNSWERQADRLEAAWPSPPFDTVRRDVYWQALNDLDATVLEDAVTAALREDRATAPSPGALRRLAEPSGANTEPARGKPRTDAEEREARRPWLALMFGILGIFPLALWLGIKALRDRTRAKTEGREWTGQGAAIAAIVLGATSLVIAGIGLAIWLTDTNPNSGNYLTTTELETSITQDGQFGTGQDQLRVEDASCVPEGPDNRRFTCLISFRGGYQQAYTVTVAEDGTWVAR